METTPRYFSQGTDFLGYLNGKLRDLRGFAVLMNELLQNADDAKKPSAHTVIFDVKEDELIVENNSVFSDCGQLEERECPWRSDPKKNHRCDFHRFRRIAGADKRHEEDTTGAFGVGFIAVYQITDSPELYSGKWHWKMSPEQPEENRIAAWDISEHHGTRFVFPWATDPNSPIRKGLNVPSISSEDKKRFLDEIALSAPKAILFLKNIETIEIKQDGKLFKRIQRINEGNTILIQDGDDTQLLYVFAGSFEEEGKRLRNRYPNTIEDKRKENVRIALASGDMDKHGVFCATLPTQQATYLPLHINADFYTDSSRKHISFEKNNEGEWNTRAVITAAELLANNLTQLPKLLDHKALWQLFEQIERVHKESEKEASKGVFTHFWIQLKEHIENAPIVFSSQSEWYVPQDIKLLRETTEEQCLPILEAIGIRVVHNDLKKHYNLLRKVEVSELNPFDIAEALVDAKMDRTIHFDDAPKWIQDTKNHDILAKTIKTLMQRHQKDSSYGRMQEQIVACAIARARDGSFTPLHSLRQADATDIKAFAPLNVQNMLLAEETPPDICDLVRKVDADWAIRLLESLPKDTLPRLWSEQPKAIIDILVWFSNHIVVTERNIVDRVKRLPIYPTDASLHLFYELVIPGSFVDPFGLASVIDSRVSEACRDFLLKTLQGKELTFKTYVTALLPKLFAHGKQPDREKCTSLKKILVLHKQDIKSDGEVLNALATLPFIECSDGKFRSAKETYIDSTKIVDLLGNSMGNTVSEVDEDILGIYKVLGVVNTPRPKDVVEHISNISKLLPTETARKKIQSIFENLGKQLKGASPDILDQYSSLKTIKWLPEKGEFSQWRLPSQISSGFRSYLFETTGKFLDIEPAIQQECAEFIRFLGIKNAPTCVEVVQHLLNCSNWGTPVNMEVYAFLNERIEECPIDTLKSVNCLCIDGEYYPPYDAFWEGHRFAPYLLQLGKGYNKYRVLFEELGVQDAPTSQDVIRVLKMISEQSDIEVQLDDESFKVVTECWRFLTNDCTDNAITEKDCLKGCLIPDKNKILQSPDRLFYEDRPNLRKHFEGYFDDFLIPYTKEEVPAMKRAGLRPLSSVIEAKVVDCDNPCIAEGIVERLNDRFSLIERVFYPDVPGEEIEERLKDTTIFSCTSLRLGYITRALGETKSTLPIDTVSYYDKDLQTIFVCSKDTRTTLLWIEFARELAYVINGDSSNGTAAAIKEVLSADTLETAHKILDAYNYPLLPHRSEVLASSSTPREIETLEDLEDATPYKVYTPYGEESIENVSIVSANIVKEEEYTGLGSENFINTGSQDTLFPDEVIESPSSSLGKPNGQAPRGGVSPRKNISQSNSDTSNTKQQGGRLRTYVYPSNEVNTSDNSLQEKRTSVSMRGVERVLRAEEIAERTPQAMLHHNKGYDIESSNAEGQIERVIEVKSLSGYWGDTGVALSTAQFELAQKLGEQYWLYVVECAEDEEKYNIIRIQNPARSVNQFLFDDGWRGVNQR